MAGNENSGRRTAAAEGAASKEAAKSRRTPETQKALDKAADQRGDRRFKVMKVYANGEKSFVGYVAQPTEEAVGLAYGGGVYECRMVDRADPTKETGEKYRLFPHPGAFPAISKYAMDPHQMERTGGFNLPPSPSGVPERTGDDGRPMTQQAIYDKAKEDLRREMEKEMAQKETARKLDEVTAKLEQLQNNPPQQKSFHEEAAQWFEFFKKMQPTPPPNSNLPPGMGGGMQGLNGLTEAVATLKALQEFSKDVQKSSLFGGDSKLSPVQETMINNFGKLFEVGLKKWEQGQPVGLNLTPPTPGAAAAGAPAAAPSPVAEKPLEMPSEQELGSMQEELADYVAKAQADYINSVPGASIQHAGTWVKNKIATGGLAWQQLGNAIKVNETEQLVIFFGQFAPDLIDTQKKKDWLAALIDLLKGPQSA